MAAKKTTKTLKRKTMKKSNRGATQKKITVVVPGDGNTHFIDIAACMSLVNQRHYEQGRNYVAKITLDPAIELNDTPPLSMDGAMYDLWTGISVLPNQWQTHTAWQLAKDAYMSARKEELASGTVMAKYEDFAVGWNDTHLGQHTDASPAVTAWGRGLLPFVHTATGTLQLPNGGTVPPNTDLVFSRVKSLGGGTTERRFGWFGVAGTNFNMVTELNKARSVVRNKVDPVASAAGAPYQVLDTNLDTDTSDYIEDDGDSAPYVISGHELGMANYQLYSFPQKGFTRLTTGYIDVPCGIIAVNTRELDFTGEGDAEEGLYSAFRIDIELREGSYKGVMAPAMGV
jgi:hypothetical protein